MTTFRLRRASGDSPRSPDGVAAQSHYEGPHGPASAGHRVDGLVTRAWGPSVPGAHLDFGPSGRLDGQPHTSFVESVRLQVGDQQGQAVQPDSGMFSRRRRGIVITVGDRTYLYRLTGISSPLLERQDRTPVARLGGVLGPGQVTDAADAGVREASRRPCPAPAQ